MAFPPSQTNPVYSRQNCRNFLRWPLPADNSVSGVFVLILWPDFYERSEVLEAIGFVKSSSQQGSFQPRCQPWSAR